MTNLQEFSKQDIRKFLNEIEDAVSDLESIITLAQSAKRALKDQIRNAEYDDTDTEDFRDRSYDYIMDWISCNLNRFRNDKNNRGVVWGKIENGIAVINRYVLQEQIEKGGFDMTATLKKLDAKGKLIRNSQGRFTHQTRVFGQKANYIKIRIDKNILGNSENSHKTV